MVGRSSTESLLWAIRWAGRRGRAPSLRVYRVYDRFTMKSVDLIRELVDAGWVLKRVRGSHHIFQHASRAGSVVVPHPKKDLGPGLVHAIRKQAGQTPT